MFCEKCGAKIDDNSVFCEKCGAKVERDSMPIATPTTQFAPQTQPAQQPSVNTATATYKEQPTYQALNTPMQQMQPQQMNVAPKPKKHLSLAALLSIIIGSVVIVGVATFFIAGTALTKPERTAERYATSLLNKDFSTAYDCLEIDNSGMTSKQAFTNFAKNIVKDAKATNIKVTRMNNNDTKVKNLRGDIKFAVTYKLSSSSTRKEQYIALIKQPSNTMLFFPTYKVSSDDLVSKNYKVRTPLGSKLVIDGSTIPDTLASKEKEFAENTYTIPKIFTGKHTVSVTAPYMQDIKGDFTVDNGGGVNITEFKFSKTCVDKMKKDAEDFVKAYFQSCADKKDFSEIKSKITASNPTDKNESSYNDHVESMHSLDKTNIKLGDCKLMSQGNGYNDDSISYRLEYRMNYTYVFSDFLDSPYDSSEYINLTYVFDNGEMKLQEAE